MQENGTHNTYLPYARFCPAFGPSPGLLRCACTARHSYPHELGNNKNGSSNTDIDDTNTPNGTAATTTIPRTTTDDTNAGRDRTRNKTRDRSRAGQENGGRGTAGGTATTTHTDQRKSGAEAGQDKPGEAKNVETSCTNLRTKLQE